MSQASSKLQQISQVNLEMVQGDDEIYRSTIKTRNFTTRVLEVYDLSAATEMTMTIKNKVDDTIYFTGTMTGAEIILEDGPNGLYRVEIDKTTTRAIPIGIHIYDVQVTTSTGKSRTAVIGDMRVVGDSTA